MKPTIPRISYVPALCMLAVAMTSVAQPAKGVTGAQGSAAAEQRVRQDMQLLLSHMAASGMLGQNPEQLSLSIEAPGRRVADLGVLVDSTSAERAHDGLRVLGTTPGGTAEHAGLRPGDLIVTVNGTSLRDLGADADGHALAATTLKSSVATLPEAESLHLDVMRDGNLVAMNAPIQSVFVPAMRVELGAAAMADSARDGGAVGGGCGRISTFDVAPRGERQYHARILLLDGVTPGPSGHETYRVSAGTHKLLVSEDIPTEQMGLGQFATLRSNRNNHKELTVDVKAGTTAMIAAQFHQDKATDLAHSGYWDPVMWREIPEGCP
jgi:hypothetical protein